MIRWIPVPIELYSTLFNMWWLLHLSKARVCLLQASPYSATASTGTSTETYRAVRHSFCDRLWFQKAISTLLVLSTLLSQSSFTLTLFDDRLKSNFWLWLRSKSMGYLLNAFGVAFSNSFTKSTVKNYADCSYARVKRIVKLSGNHFEFHLWLLIEAYKVHFM